MKLCGSLPDLLSQIMYIVSTQAKDTTHKQIATKNPNETLRWSLVWRDFSSVIIFSRSVFTAFVTNGILCWWDSIPAGREGIYLSVEEDLKGGLTKQGITVTRWLVQSFSHPWSAHPISHCCWVEQLLVVDLCCPNWVPFSKQVSLELVILQIETEWKGLNVLTEM